MRSIAFLRAINVGGRVVKMERLRSVFETIGCRDVETFIASGNVIFTTQPGDPRLMEKKIEAALQAALGYEVKTFIRTDAEVARIAGQQPFGALAGGEGTLFIGLLHAHPSAESRTRLLAARTTSHRLEIDGHELYWLRRGTSSDSDFSGAKLEKLLGMPTTIRNVNTIRRLAAKYPPPLGVQFQSKLLPFSEVENNQRHD